MCVFCHLNKYLNFDLIFYDLDKCFNFDFKKSHLDKGDCEDGPDNVLLWIVALVFKQAEIRLKFACQKILLLGRFSNKLKSDGRLLVGICCLWKDSQTS